jgi:hypothetical protein
MGYCQDIFGELLLDVEQLERYFDLWCSLLMVELDLLLYRDL